MRKHSNNIFFGLDWPLVFCFLTLVVFGWLNIYATTSSDTHSHWLDLSTKYGKQLIWIAISLPLIVAILYIDAKFFERFASFFYLAGLSMLAGLFLFGNTINGATSWYAIGGFSIQPSEFVKIATALALAKLLSEKPFNLKLFSDQLKAFAIIAIPAILITLQPDPGSALVYMAMVFVMHVEGLPSGYITTAIVAISLFLLTLMFGLKLILIGLFILAFIFFFYFLFIKQKTLYIQQWAQVISIGILISLFVYSVDYVFYNIFEQRHRDRFSLLLGNTVDNKGIGYNTHQSLMAISSGGLTGKGHLEGARTQGDFVPEQHTDYIFSAIGEEWGFIGSSLVILIFVIFQLRILHLAESQKNPFSRLYGHAIAAIFFFHFLINIGMVMGLFPTIGIPLPFFSYGGSSLWGFTILLFIFLKLNSEKHYEW